MKPIGKEKSARMLDDLLHARHDLLKLGPAHGVKPDELAEWINQPQIQRVLVSLSRLADFQPQMLLSRYRSLAVSRLIKLATAEPADDGEQGHKIADLARRACVDMLRINLDRTQPATEPETDEIDPAQALRQMLYGQRQPRDEDTEEVEDA